jgi:hypothetical protein
MQPGMAAGHATPQSPQFFGSVARTAQVPPQSASPLAAHVSGT